MIEWSETEILIRDSIREFVDREIRPRVDDLEHGGTPPYEVIRKFFAAFGVDAMAREAFTAQLAKARAREQQGGASSTSTKNPLGGGTGGQEAMALIAFTELCRVCPGIVGSLGVSLGLTASTIMSKGTLDQQERWVPDLLSFDKVGAWAITEPDAGSDALGAMATTVRRDGEGYRLRGQKTFITNGPYADTLVVYAKLDEGDGTDRRDRSVLTFVLDTGLEGLTQGRPMRKMGFSSSPTGELFFDDVYLAPDRLLGDADQAASAGREGVKANFAFERFGVAAMALGIIEECLARSVNYAKDRTLWDKPIGDLQLIQLKLATMEVARLNVQNLVFRVVEMLREGRLPSLAEASAIKLYSSRAATEVAMEAVQLFGGNGYMSEYRVEQLARDAKSLEVYAGSSEVQVTHIAKDLLRR